MNRNVIFRMVIILVGLGAVAAMAGCGDDNRGALLSNDTSDGLRIIFLHHSTGGVIWDGGVSGWFDDYNAAHDTNYRIIERSYPADGYPWANYPYDYWDIWVKHAGNRRYKKQDTLEILTENYDIIVWKHCFPVSDVGPDTGSPDVTSDVKSIENYKLQYKALEEKMGEFPNTRFIVWTGAAQVAGATNEANARRAKQFFDWVIKTWDEPGDNIYIWDFWQLETEGGLYLSDQYAASSTDSHPNSSFAAQVTPYFAQRIVDVIEGQGDTSSLTGQ